MITTAIAKASQPYICLHQNPAFGNRQTRQVKPYYEKGGLQANIHSFGEREGRSIIIHEVFSFHTLKDRLLPMHEQ